MKEKANKLKDKCLQSVKDEIFDDEVLKDITENPGGLEIYYLLWFCRAFLRKEPGTESFDLKKWDEHMRANGVEIYYLLWLYRAFLRKEPGTESFDLKKWDERMRAIMLGSDERMKEISEIKAIEHLRKILPRFFRG